MADSYTQTTSTSWFSRIKGSLKGILLGIILFAAAIFLLWWNEARAVKVAKGLTEGSKTVVSVSAEKILPDHEGKLVHTSGPLTSEETLYDEVFAVSAPKAIKLRRQVEMYQWVEEASTQTEKKLGGSEEAKTTYTYKKTWVPRAVDSQSFQKPAGHENPGSLPYEAKTHQASEVKLQAFKLSNGLMGQLTQWRDLPAKETDLANLPPELRNRAQVVDGKIFIGDNSAQPKVGDLRVSFQKVDPSEVSVIAVQTGSTFKPFTTQQGTAIEMLNLGQVEAAKMFEQAQSANRTMTWILRAIGFFLFLFAFSLILRPFSVLADVLPFAGRLVGMGMGFVSFILAAILTLLIIGAAWLAARPLLGGAIIAVVVALVVLFFIKMKRAKPQTQAAPNPA